MMLYHRTTRKNAESILTHGFKDGEGKHLTDQVWRGVWVSDRPLDGNEGAYGDVLFRIHLGVPAREMREKYEWIEAAKGYREFLIPADVLNARLKKLRIEEGVVRFPGSWPPPFTHGEFKRVPLAEAKRAPGMGGEQGPKSKRRED